MKKSRFGDILRDRLNIFYMLAFLPLLLIEYYRYVFFNNALGVLIPLYGFLLLLIKKDKLSKYAMNTNNLQRVSGIIIVLGSFFLYYAIVPFVPSVGFYGITNYFVLLSGLLLIFFEIPAFKEAFTSFFLLAAGALSGLAFRWIELQISPVVPYYVYLFASVLRILGITATTPNPTTLMLYKSEGMLPVPVLFEAGCIGVYSLLIFSTLLVITMVESNSSKRTKLLWSAIGLIGVFVVNIIRLIIVILAIYFYGYPTGQSVHQVIGYILFLSWLAIFLYMFSKRQTIIGKIQFIRQRIAALVQTLS